MKQFIFIVILSLAAIISSCKKEDMKFANTTFNVINSRSASAKITSDNGVLHFSQTPDSWKAIRLSEKGIELWSTDLISMKNVFPRLSIHTFTPTPDGGGVFGGEFYSDTATYNHSVGLLVKLNASGIVIWSHAFDTMLTAGSRHVEEMTFDEHGDIVVIQKIYTDVSTDYLLRFSSDGHLFSHTALYDVVSYKKIISLPGGDLLFLTRHGNTYEIAKTDSVGALRWRTTVAAFQFYEELRIVPEDLEMSPSGLIYISGYANQWSGVQENNFDYFLFRIDSSGSVVDSLRWPGYANEYNRSCYMGRDGSVYLIGTTCSLPAIFNEVTNSGDYHIELKYNLTVFSRCYLIKLDVDGHTLWKKLLGNDFGSEGLTVSENSNGDLLVCGNQVGFGNKNEIHLFSQILSANGE